MESGETDTMTREAGSGTTARIRGNRQGMSEDVWEKGRWDDERKKACHNDEL